MAKPFSQSSENNKHPILEKLKPLLKSRHSVLEVGSGTGQHAVHFAHAMPHIHWQTSDLPANHHGINLWLSEAKLANLYPPLTLDLNQPWPVTALDVIYTANTLHIVNAQLVQRFFHQAAQHIAPQGLLIIYGPFKYQGKFTSDSNASFDEWLKERDNNSGIRNIEWIVELANAARLQLIDDHQMPANNQLLVFTTQG